jgi:hypothetical protein
MSIPQAHERVVVDKKTGATMSKLAIHMAVASGCARAQQYFENQRKKRIEENKKAQKEKEEGTS